MANNNIVNEKINVFVKFNRTTMYQLNNTTTIKELKDMITDKEGIPSELYYLMCGTRILTEGSLNDNNIGNETTIYLILRIGGKPNKT